MSRKRNGATLAVVNLVHFFPVSSLLFKPLADAGAHLEHGPVKKRGRSQRKRDRCPGEILKTDGIEARRISWNHWRNRSRTDGRNSRRTKESGPGRPRNALTRRRMRPSRVNTPHPRRPLPPRKANKRSQSRRSRHRAASFLAHADPSQLRPA